MKSLKTRARKEYQLEVLCSRLGEIRERTDKERKKLEEVRLRVREICSKCYMTPRLDVFQSAQKALGNYGNGLMKVQIAHGNYRNGVRYVKSQEEYLQTIDEDLDDIRYELGKIIRRRRETEAELFSVKEQLKLTDYEQIQDRLETCILRLNRIPEEREISVGRQQDLKNQEEVLNEKYLENEKNWRISEDEGNGWEKHLRKNIIWAMWNRKFQAVRIRKNRQPKYAAGWLESSATENRPICLAVSRKFITRIVCICWSIR
ncbi:MAG: hypothetical protein ACI4EO_02510 [Blautia sp.]